MLSFNYQQGATPGADLSMSNDNGHQWTTVNSKWDEISEFIHSNKRYESLSHQATAQPRNLNVSVEDWSNQIVPQYPQYQCNGNAFSNEGIFTQMPTSQNQIPVYHPPSFYPKPNQYLQPQNHSTTGRSHQARINFVPNSRGGFKAVVKRKRKRTMFTTEQVEAMESVFQRKPYVTRDDRQVLVQQLQLSDTSIKVWFQNRRLRGKRAAEEAAAEQALYEENNASEQPFCSMDSMQQDSVESFSSSGTISRLDAIEYELSQKVDDSGYITLDDKSMEDIVAAIDNVLAADINLDSDATSSSEDVNLPTNSSKSQTESKEGDDVESEGSTYSSSVYEPISPAASPKSDVANEDNMRWHPFAADQSLQRLFDLHFC